jgi:hypothetical protein
MNFKVGTIFLYTTIGKKYNGLALIEEKCDKNCIVRIRWKEDNNLYNYSFEYFQRIIDNGTIRIVV